MYTLLSQSRCKDTTFFLKLYQLPMENILMQEKRKRLQFRLLHKTTRITLWKSDDGGIDTMTDLTHYLVKLLCVPACAQVREHSSEFSVKCVNVSSVTICWIRCSPGAALTFSR